MQQGKSATRQLSIHDDQLEKGQIESSKTKHTLVFIYPCKGHFYVPLMFQTFLMTICSLPGAVRGSHIVHMTFMDRSFKNFICIQMLYLVNRGGEEAIVLDDGTGRPKILIVVQLIDKKRNFAIVGQHQIFSRKKIKEYVIELIEALFEQQSHDYSSVGGD